MAAGGGAIGASFLDIINNQPRHCTRRQEKTAMKKGHRRPKGMGLNDFVAHQEGFFAAEGLDVTFDWKTFRRHAVELEGPQLPGAAAGRPYTKDNAEVIQGACVWARSATPPPAWGKFVAEAYGIRPGRSSCGRIRKSANRRI